MLRDPTDVEVDQTVWLYPQTKQASRACHQQLQVKVGKDPAAHWPMVLVVWGDRWEIVHKDNIRKKSPAARVKADEKEGDSTRDSGGMGRWAKVRKLPAQPKAKLDPNDGEQGVLL